MKNEFINCFIVNISNGRFGDTHRALNAVFYAWWSFLFPLTRDICITKDCKEVNT